MSVADFQGIIKILSDNKVEFVIIGGLAMVFHGSSLATRDVDVRYGRTPANLQRLALALAPLHPYLHGAPPGLLFRLDPATLEAGLNFTLETDLGPLDLIGEVSGVGFYEHALRQSVPGDFLGSPVRILTIDGLLATKLAAGRPRDQAHVLELQELKKLLGDRG